MVRLAAVVFIGCTALSAACSSSTTSPTAQKLPTFVYVSDADGPSHLYLFRNDSSIRVTTDDGNDTDPRSAAGLIVYTSDRDGDQEIYISDTLGAVQRRVTSNAANDFQADLSPDGDQIAFTSNRTGLPRIWIVPAPALTDTGFPIATQLATGTDGTVPEQSPSWSPDGSQVAFTSTRTGSSQVFVVPAAGGQATQVSHVAGGAVAPVWSADGKSVLFESLSGMATIVRINLLSGAATTVATDSLGVGEPTCNARFCLGVTNPLDTTGTIVSFLASASSGATKPVMTRTANERQPAILVAR